MLQAHSFLWHYFWLAPHILQLALALLLWRRGVHRQLPFFFAYLIFEAIEEFILYGLDISPSISVEVWWRAFWAGLILEGLLKFAVIGELLSRLLQPWPALAKFGSNFIRSVGATLILLAALAAAFVTPDNNHWVISGAHILRQTLYLTQAGLILSIFLLAAYFHVAWDRISFGIALAFGLVWCQHLADWALTAGGTFMSSRDTLDMVNMVTYQLAVLIWFYYFLVPEKVSVHSVVILSEHNLDIWNRELERFLQP